MIDEELIQAANSILRDVKFQLESTNRKIHVYHQEVTAGELNIVKIFPNGMVEIIHYRFGRVYYADLSYLKLFESVLRMHVCQNS